MGHHLFDLYLLGMKSKEYVLLERSKVGRQCADLVYSLFNNFEDIPVFESRQNVILFSPHSIEQVSKFACETFDILIDKFPHVENLYGIYLEPIISRYLRRNIIISYSTREMCSML